jgi:hypothetical protein
METFARLEDLICRYLPGRKTLYGDKLCDIVSWRIGIADCAFSITKQDKIQSDIQVQEYLQGDWLVAQHILLGNNEKADAGGWEQPMHLLLLADVSHYHVMEKVWSCLRANVLATIL